MGGSSKFPLILLLCAIVLIVPVCYIAKNLTIQVQLQRRHLKLAKENIEVKIQGQQAIIDKAKEEQFRVEKLRVRAKKIAAEIMQMQSKQKSLKWELLTSTTELDALRLNHTRKTKK